MCKLHDMRCHRCTQVGRCARDKVAKLQICRMWMALCSTCKTFRVREVSAKAFRVFLQKTTNGYDTECFFRERVKEQNHHSIKSFERKHPLCKDARDMFFLQMPGQSPCWSCTDSNACQESITTVLSPPATCLATQCSKNISI